MTWYVKNTDPTGTESSDNDIKQITFSNHREQSVKCDGGICEYVIGCE